MQTYLLPSSICRKVDGLLRDFWWGVDWDTGRGLYLKSWDTICTPKEIGGLGMRKIKDTNVAFVTKLNWQFCTQLNRHWVKILKSKYCRGHDFLEFNPHSASGSWVWQSMQHCKAALLHGICHSVRSRSKLRIRDVPWIPDVPNFKIPADVCIPPQFHYVEDLMWLDGRSWNQTLLMSILPPAMAQKILKIHILD